MEQVYSITEAFSMQPTTLKVGTKVMTGEFIHKIELE